MPMLASTPRRERCRATNVTVKMAVIHTTNANNSAKRLCITAGPNVAMYVLLSFPILSPQYLIRPEFTHSCFFD